MFSSEKRGTFFLYIKKKKLVFSSQQTNNRKKIATFVAIKYNMY